LALLRGIDVLLQRVDNLAILRAFMLGSQAPDLLGKVIG
jgi:hypothetical protein